MSAGAWVLVAAVVLAVGLGVYRAAVDGRFRGTHRVGPASSDAEGSTGSSDEVVDSPGALVAAAVSDVSLGERATLLQFSSAFCAPCRATRRTLADIATAVPGVSHVEIDAEHHLELVRRLGVLRTPTTLILDARGVELTRAAGAPRKEQVLAALGLSLG